MWSYSAFYTVLEVESPKISNSAGESTGIHALPYTGMRNILKQIYCGTYVLQCHSFTISCHFNHNLTLTKLLRKSNCLSEILVILNWYIQRSCQPSVACRLVASSRVESLFPRPRRMFKLDVMRNIALDIYLKKRPIRQSLLPLMYLMRNIVRGRDITPALSPRASSHSDLHHCAMQV